MLTLEQARTRLLQTVAPLGRETIAVRRAHGRCLAERILSPLALPAFANSSMDGYAVRAEDVRTAGPDRPVALRVVGRAEAGQPCVGSLGPGTAVRIFTGAPIPPGADAVVMQEDVRPVSGETETVEVLAGAQPGEHIRRRGADVSPGAIVGDAGQWIHPGRLALLSSIGLSVVQVGQVPSVALLATGSELVEAGETLRAGQIYDSNRTMLAALTSATGAEPRVQPLVGDSLEATVAALEAAARAAEVVITSGGVSVGETDYVKAAWERLGGEIDLWKVAMRPGKPFVYGRWRDRYLFGLPGNPASALVTFLLLVRPALLRLQGASEVELPSHPGVLAEPVANRGDRRHFLRVTVDGTGQVRLAGLQESHAVTSLAAANGLVEAPPGTAWRAGTTVKVLRWG